MSLTLEQAKIASRQELLERTFAGFKELLGAGFEHLDLNRIVLHNIVVSYFDDVNRHKDFHGTDRVDDVKQAAFTMKWIAKLRPIQFSCEESEVSQQILFINEIFAVRCGLSFMKISPSNLPDQLYEDLLYTLRYRHMDERMLFVWLSTLKCLREGELSLDEE